jgi:hypothetical protein
MNRRNAIKNLGLSFGALAVTPTMIGMLQSCATTTSDFSPKFFFKNQLSDIQLLLDVILPSTDDGIPGATELGLLKFIDAFLDGVVEEDQLRLLQFGVSSMITSAKTQPANDLSDKRSYWETQAEKYFTASETQENTWHDELSSLSEGVLDKESISTGALHFMVFQSLRGFAVYAFRINSTIGKEFMHYAPIPGQQLGCVSLEEATNGKLHALEG